ncbi:hypothetical protein BYT27DRAFT_7200793 [Phlegmacium glaucopus]|nr:hypothetical protein BYT27DRAFT_7200793 [Phlegmacium glaucopus]
MSGGVSSYQGKGGTLELKIIVRYEGLKATQYFSKYTSESDVVLRDDLLTLKLPHPKRENTTFISYGCVECVWPLVPRNGLLHKQIMTKTRPHNPHEQQALATLLGQLSISNLAAKEIYPDVGRGRKSLKRPNPFTNWQGSEGSSSGMHEGNSYRVSTKSLPTTEIPQHSAAPKATEATEAEAFLQDVRDSLRPHKIPKIEPVDIPLPPDSFPKRTLPRSTSSHSSHLSSASKATNPPESVSSSSWPVPQAKVLPPPATKPKSDSGQIIKSTSLPDKPTPIKEMLRELQPLLSTQSPQEPTQRQSPVPGVKMMNMTPIPAPQRPTTDTISRPKVSDVPKIQRLTRESCDIRRQITADAARDATIISELKQLNAAYIPQPLKVGNTDTNMEARIKKLEQDLEAERRMRLEAEDVIRDIRREYKAPFVVPGLLDAFIKLSRLTTQATRSNGTVTKDNG